MKRRVKLAPEYGTGPLWLFDADGIGRNIAPTELRLSVLLIQAIADWDLTFQRTFDESYPPDSRFGSLQDERDFLAAGRELKRRLQDELGPDYSVELDFA